MTTSDKDVQLADLLDAIQDQSRIVIALQGKFAKHHRGGQTAVGVGHCPGALAKARKRSKGDTNGLADMNGDDAAGPEATQ